MLILIKTKLYIDNIYWERVQLFIEGHVDNLNIEKSEFVLRNLTETKELKANQVEINENRFICRFNVAILDNGYYLYSGQYLLVNKQQEEHIATMNQEVINQFYEQLDETELALYEALETSNAKVNFLLERLMKEFHKGGNSSTTVYTVKPEISSEVNELVLNVMYKVPRKRNSMLIEMYKEMRLKYRSYAYNIRDSIFKSIFYVTKFFHLRKGKTVLFTSDSRSNMSGNFKFIYDEMIKVNLDQKYDIHALFKPHITERRKFIDKFKFPYLLGKADYIFVDDYHPMLYKVKFRKSQEIIQVWHAVGAFKTVGFSRTGKKGGPFFNSLNHPCTLR